MNQTLEERLVEIAVETGRVKLELAKSRRLLEELEARDLAPEDRPLLVEAKAAVAAAEEEAPAVERRQRRIGARHG